MAKHGITTHVLDTSSGRPASGVPVALELAAAAGKWRILGRATTDGGGRVADLLHGESLLIGTYRLSFDTAAYFAARQVRGFYPEVHVIFEVRDVDEHYHVPLLLSPHGYSTYKGS